VKKKMSKCPHCGGTGIIHNFNLDAAAKAFSELAWSQPTVKGYQWVKRGDAENNPTLREVVPSLRPYPNWLWLHDFGYILTGDSQGLIGRIPRRR